MSRRGQFETIRSEGALLPPDLLQRVGERDRELGGLRGEDYGLPPNEPLNEVIVRSWNRLVGAWGSFRKARETLSEGDPGTSATRDRWLLVLLQELGYGRVQTASAVEIEGKPYAISHAWESVPIHLVGCNVPLDHRSRGVAGAATQSPHGTMQELLNRSDERLWGILSNGLILRVLRDNSSLTRQAFLEFDLEQMLEGEVYADFVLLWMTCHASRVEGEKPHQCWLELWSQEAVKQGTRALDGLRRGVEDAISALGSGFLQPGRNPELKAVLRDGELATQDYYRELLRLVYRLLFLFVAEDRGLLLDPRAPDDARARYAEWYSTRRLRTLAERRRGTKHGDLYEQLKLVMGGLGSDDGCPQLGLPPLGSFLWSPDALRHLHSASLSNGALLEAMRALATVRDGNVLRSVDYKNLGAEELGSVYESLLELHPDLDPDAGTFALTTAAGNERKTTGSYYTPASLISCLLDSALDPVLDEAAAKGEEAVLDLKVVDPASGSGHFLVAAAHRIAKRLAALRTGDEEPSPEATRGALRDVVGHCLYGVDVNPMAVELCKVSLWMEALDPGRPLSFLDAHIKCGNSLLGTTSALISGGIPDDAFKPLEGDDNETAKSLRRQNKAEREGQLTLEDATTDLAGALERKAAALEAADDATVDGLHAKERLFNDLVASDEFARAKLTADAWCAAFVQPKAPGAPRITTGIVRRISSGVAMPGEVTEAVGALAREYGLFHWEVEFPQVFAREAGGFDVVLGNPPWDQVQLDPREFFAERRPEIATALNMAAREKLIAALDPTDPDRAAYDLARRQVSGIQQYVHASDRFPLTARGRINTAPLFAETGMSIVGLVGRVGLILPGGIATDSFTQEFFKNGVRKGRFVSLFSFENEAFIFPSVHHAFRFVLLTAVGRSALSSKLDCVFYARRVSDLNEPDRHFVLTVADLELFNPITQTCPTFRSKRDAELNRTIYDRVSVLGIKSDESWSFGGLLMFMMNTGSRVFEMSAGVGRVPLYEAKLAHQFTHRWGTYAGDEVRLIADAELENARFEPMFRYWVAEPLVRKQLSAKHVGDWLIAWRDITGAEKVRTVIASALPNVGVGATLRVAIFKHPDLAASLLACLNSFVLDYAARQKVGGTHLSQHVIDQLPVPLPAVFRSTTPWCRDLSFDEWLRPRVVELSYTSFAVQGFAQHLGYGGSPLRWDLERRALLRAELDAAFFHAYGLEEEDVNYVMETFPIVKRRDEEKHGHYRTKALILDVYGKMSDAMVTGMPYRTSLDPPPADPRVAHPPRDSAMLVQTQ